MTIQDLWERIKRDPFSVLGFQQLDKGYGLRVLNSTVDEVYLCHKKNVKGVLVPKEHDFTFYLEVDVIPEHYYLRFVSQGVEWIERDPYGFPPVLSEYDLYLFSEGTHRRIWEMLGSQIVECNDIKGTCFSVWAPHAKSVRLVGDYNGWDKGRHYMRLRGATGVWEIFVPDLVTSTKYKYVVESSNGHLVEKSDPYTFYAEKRPHTASISYSLDGYEWKDEEWTASRNQHLDKALSIYECHLDTWMRDDRNSPLNYETVAGPLADYLVDHGFTHVELMPVSEFPFDGSWGYQVTGYYAPTSRYGTPHDFMAFVDHLHQKGIGVIVDWVPAHFPNDEHGLAHFDGTALYEHEDPRMGWHHDWGTHIFNYGRNEVRQFLVGSALYWIEMYHIDGLRVDAVASMLYLDYSRKEGEWIPNKYGGRENLEAIEFLQSLHSEIECYYPGVMTIAEESTAYRGVTAPTTVDGLGFTYKWNMGWMNDTLRYFSIDPMFRSWHHNEITFSLVYAFSERYILPFSHDEVVHGKGTLLDRMPGSDWEKFANLRLMYTYMWAHPGKKLLFAGQEWAPWKEWSETSSIDWHLNLYPLHSGMRLLIKDLNAVYKQEPALYELDQDPHTFEWVNCDDHLSGVLMWMRKDKDNKALLIVLNLNPIAKDHYRIGVPRAGVYREIFNSDKSNYGGANVLNNSSIGTEDVRWQKKSHSLEINLGPLAGVIFRVDLH